MGVWNFTNVGASPKPEFRKYVEKIFDYIGYASVYGYMDEDDYCPDPDDVYRCKDSNYEEWNGYIRRCFRDYGYDERDLFDILNALFPNTGVYIHHSEGNSLGWLSHEEYFDTDRMIYYTVDDEYNDDFDSEYEEETDVNEEEEEEPIVMKPPKPEHIDALIELSTADGNEELTALLLELSRKMKEGFID